MTLDQLIATSASVAAGISALATFFTVIQIHIQRKASYRPELVFAKTHFTVDGSVKTKEHNDRNFKIDLFNIGLGAAKNFKIEWSFPIESSVKKVNSLIGQPSENYKLENGILSWTRENNSHYMSMWKSQKNTSIDFFLPASISKDPVNITIPDAYASLWIEHFKNCALREDYSNTNFPPLKATITYQDIGGTRYKFKYSVALSYSSFTHPSLAITGTIETTST